MSEQWNGEGLPPVGTICEYNASLIGWSRAEITAVGRDHICFVVDGLKTEQVTTFLVYPRFRPYRTPEEKEAAAREKAVLAIEEIILGYGYRESAELLYDKGYRKVEGAKE